MKIDFLSIPVTKTDRALGIVERHEGTFRGARFVLARFAAGRWGLVAILPARDASEANKTHSFRCASYAAGVRRAKILAVHVRLTR